jgi:hypothetical protein
VNEAGTPQEDSGAKPWSQQAAVWVLSFILLYLFSFGPMIFVMAKLPAPMADGMEGFLEVVYYPHIWLAQNCPPYMSYAEYWLDLAGVHS